MREGVHHRDAEAQRNQKGREKMKTEMSDGRRRINTERGGGIYHEGHEEHEGKREREKERERECVCAKEQKTERKKMRGEGVEVGMRKGG
ncbi:MAG: hypothetical protein JNM86_03690 [Phycisphaerae bacterium]|nr:hypothetical protein [Phycisphaerae bacterium]